MALINWLERFGSRWALKRDLNDLACIPGPTIVTMFFRQKNDPAPVSVL
jgi:hypothetical protein